MPSKQLPASIRSLKVRLRTLQRPSVWVSAAVLLGAIVLLAETWKHPEWFANDNWPLTDQTAANSADTDPPARPNPAPLDPFSSVDQPQFGTAGDAEEPLSSLSSTGLPDANDANQLDLPLLLPPGRLPAARSSSSPSVPDPFASIRVRSDPETSNGSEGGASSFSSGFSNGSQSNGSQSNGSQSNGSQSPFGSNNQSSGSPSPSSMGTNPLESAIDRHNSPTSVQSLPSPQSNLASPNSNLDSTATSPELQTPTAPGIGQPTFVQPQPIPGQPSYGQTQPQPQFLPQTAPAPGTTGYTQPPAFRTNANTPAGPSFGTYNNSNSQNTYSPSGVPSTVSPSVPQSGTTVQPQFQPAPSQPTPAPFSVPRAAPGQAIGGGRINSFSNP